MKTFKVGDRVCVKCVNYKGDLVKQFGVLEEIRETWGTCHITLDGSPYYSWFSRGLVFSVKPKRKPREFWIERPDGNGFQYWDTIVSDAPDCVNEEDFKHAIHVREVIGRKK